MLLSCAHYLLFFIGPFNLIFLNRNKNIYNLLNIEMKAWNAVMFLEVANIKEETFLRYTKMLWLLHIYLANELGHP